MSSKFSNLNKLSNKTLKVREDNYRLKYNFWQKFGIICCYSDRCKSNQLIFKDNQYDSCMKEVENYTNLEYIIKKVKEIEYIKAIVFDREQTIAFSFFHKPWIGEKNKKINKTINQIHYDQFEIPLEERLELVKEYYSEIDLEKLNKVDGRIIELIDTDFI